MKLINKIERQVISQIAGVSIHYNSPDEISICYLVMKLHKGKTEVVESGINLDSLQSMAEVLDKKIPLWLCINGRLVISKPIKDPEGKQLLNQLLPNASEKDFLLTTTPMANQQVLASTFRAEQFKKLVNEMNTLGYTILGYSLGPGSAGFTSVAGLLQNETISIPGYELSIEKNEISHYRTASNYEEEDLKYTLGDEQVSSNLLLPFNLALCYLASRKGFDQSDNSTHLAGGKNYIDKKINQFLLFVALGLLFLILLLNFFLFSSANRKYQTLAGELSYNQVFFNELDSLKKEVNLKTSLVKQMGLSERTTQGLFIDRIAATVPKSITLEKLQLNPLKEKIKYSEPLEFQNFILIEGYSGGSLALNDWVEELKKYDWIADLDIILYERIEDKGYFKIRLLYK